MRENIALSTINFQDDCKVEKLINKIQNTIDSYQLGLMPVWAFAYKIEEFSKKINEEVSAYE